MCLATPGKVVEAWGEGLERAGIVDHGGVRREVSFAYLPDTQPGDYVLVHVGLALSRVDPDAARRALAELDELLPEGAPRPTF